VPVWPVCSLLSLAVEGAAASGGGPRIVAAVINARRGEVYAGLYAIGSELGAHALVPPLVSSFADFEALAVSALGARMAEVLWVGSGAVEAGRAPQGTEGSGMHRGSATRHALLGAAAFAAVGKNPARVPALDATYLRKSEAELNAEKALARRAAMGD